MIAGAVAWTACVAATLYTIAIRRARAYDVPFAPCDRSALLTFGIGAAVAVALSISGRLTWSASALGAIAAVCAITDAQTGYVFDRVLVAGALVSAAAAWGDHRVAAAAAGATAMATFFGALFAVTQRRGIGLGDVKLAIVLGGGLGAHAAAAAAGWAFALGAIVYAPRLLSGRANRRTEVRFAPFLAAGAQAALLGLLP